MFVAENMQCPTICPLCEQEAELISHILTGLFFAVMFDTMFSANGPLQPLAPQPDDAYNSRFQSTAERVGPGKIKNSVDADFSALVEEIHIEAMYTLVASAWLLC